MEKAAVIGVGNMGGALVSGMLQNKIIEPDNLILCNRTLSDLEDYKKLGCWVTERVNEEISSVKALIIAVKPQDYKIILPEIKKYINYKQLVISLAAGIEIRNIKEILGHNQPVVRIMPNLAATVRESISVWVKSPEVEEDQEKIVREILTAIGKEALLPEEKMIDAATAISGNGPAYVFYLTELLENNARDMGIPADLASLLSRQTVIGGAKLLELSKDSVKELRLKVTSKGGTTEAAFAKFDEINLKAVFRNGIRAAWKRAKEMRLD